MLLAHALALAEARTHVASMADQADSYEASSAYEHVLIELDRIHIDDCPALYDKSLSADRSTLLAGARRFIEELEKYGIDPLSVELVLAMLDDACALDVP